MPNFSRLLLLTATFVTFSVGGMDRDTEEIPGPMFHGERDVAEQHFEHLLMHPDPETQLMNAQKLVLHPEGVPEHILQRAQDVRERHFLLLDDADPNVRLEAAQTIVRSDRDPGNWPAHVREKVQEIMVGHPEGVPERILQGAQQMVEGHFEHLLMHPDPETQLMNAQKLVLHPEGVPEHILQRAQDVRERHFLLLDDADPNVRLEAAQTIVRSDRDPGNWPAHVREKVQEIMVGHP